MVRKRLIYWANNCIFFTHSGMHHKGDCDSNKVIKDVEKNLEFATKAKKLYPKRLKVTRVYDEEDRYDKLNPNGGWADIRDHLLCLNMTLGLR
jgi:N-acetylglucosaminyltransferase II (MGAT2)